MKNHGTSILPLVAAQAVFLAAAAANADDPKKPAAVAASTSAPKTDGAPANAKPAAVQASTGKLSFATHMKVVEAYVPLKMLENGKEVAHDLDKASVTVVGHDGVEATISFEEWAVDRNDFANAGGVTALQILVEQGYFKYIEGIGFVPTKDYKGLRGIKDDGGGDNSHSQDSNTKSSFLDVEGGPALVDDSKTESVAEDPSQQGGLFGYGYDGPVENYDTSDPNTPEGKKKILRDSLSTLSRQCYATPESTEYWSCYENCNDLLFAVTGKISQDKVNECQNDCTTVFERNKPQVCREADAAKTQLEQLGDE